MSISDAAWYSCKRMVRRVNWRRVLPSLYDLYMIALRGFRKVAFIFMFYIFKNYN